MKTALSLFLLFSLPILSAEFHVATNGCDDNAGTAEAPFATIARARDAVRAQGGAGRTADVTVIIHGGRYELREPLAFGPDDGGGRRSSVTYAAAANESVVISGGSKIGGWKKDGSVWVAQVPPNSSFRQLHAGEERLPRARFPKQGYLRIQSVSPDVKRFAFDGLLPEVDLAGQGAELVVLQNWSVARAMVATSDVKSLTTATPVGWIGHGACTASAGKPAFIEHASSLVEQPGEWHLDVARGILRLAGDDPTGKEIVAPRLGALLRVVGRKDAPVRNLRFVHLQFRDTDFPLPAEGYSEIQAAHFGPAENKPTFVQPVAIEFSFAEHCRMEQCRLAHLGASGIGLGPGCRSNAITRCRIEDIGGNGVFVGWRGRGDVVPGQSEGLASLDADWKDPMDAPVGNAVERNVIRRCGASSFGAVGIWVGFSADTRLAHNEVYDLPYTGISVGYRWNTTETSQRRCVVEYNHIHDVMKMLADGGGIYTLGYQPGTVLRGNHIHDIARTDFAHGGAPNNGIFLDEGSKGYLIEGNIIYNAHGGPIRHNQNQPAWHTWTNNHFNVKPGAPEFPAELAKRAGPAG